MWEGTCAACCWNPTHYNEAVLLITSWLFERRVFNGHYWVECGGRMNYKWRLRNVKEIEGNKWDSFQALPRVRLEGLRKATKSVPRDNRPAMVPVNFQNKKHEFHVDAHCISTALRLKRFLRNSLSPVFTKQDRSRDLTWLVSNVRSVFYPPKYYLLATCLRPLHRHHESSNDEMVSYTLRQLCYRKEFQMFTGEESGKALKQI